MLVFPQSEQERIELLICSPHQPVRIISAKLSGRVQALQILWPNSPKRFIYNGQEMVESLTFDAYGIKSGESIIALPREDHEFDLQWKKVTSDRLEFNCLVLSMTNPKTANEVARLRDLHMFEMVMKPRLFRKMKRAYETNDFGQIKSADDSPDPTEMSPEMLHKNKKINRQPEKQTELNIDYQTNYDASFPPEDPLPVLW